MGVHRFTALAVLSAVLFTSGLAPVLSDGGCASTAWSTQLREVTIAPGLAQSRDKSAPAIRLDAVEELAHILLICRESNGRIEIISSQLVPGAVKRAYRVNPMPNVAQLLDRNGSEVTRAFYQVFRELRWTDVKQGSNELTGGSVPATEIVYPVRVPYSSRAALLRLSQVGNMQAPRFSQSKAVLSEQVSLDSAGTQELLTVPLSELPGPAEVTR